LFVEKGYTDEMCSTEYTGDDISSKEGKEDRPSSLVPSTSHDEADEVVGEPLPEDVEEATVYVSEAACSDKWVT
jgi:hypothetical protein